MLVTTPYLDEAEQCHRVGLLHEGRLLAIDAVGALKDRLPCRMVLLSPVEGQKMRRAEAIAVAEALPGRFWTQPLGTAIRVALDPEAPLIAPSGYTLTEVPPNLEDSYIWLCGAIRGVEAR